MSKPLINVAAGLILRTDGRLLLAERPSGKPWAGWWELPGGKIEPGETVLGALARELEEELSIKVTAASPWVTYTHEYPKNRVRLAFCRVTGWTGTAIGAEGQTLAWVDPRQPILVGPLLPATEPPLRWLQLPDHYLVTSIGSHANLPHYIERLTQALRGGLKLVQFREPAWPDSSTGKQDIYDGFQQVLQCCHDHGARCLLNSAHPESWWRQADGVHFRAADAAAIHAGGTATLLDAAGLAHHPRKPLPDTAPQVPDVSQEPQSMPGSSNTTEQRKKNGYLIGKNNYLIAVSAHTADELALARLLGADFAVLGHVLETPSHANQSALGWDSFQALAEAAGIPVFAIGGQSNHTLALAQQHGAHGIAGIRHLLP